MNELIKRLRVFVEEHGHLWDDCDVKTCEDAADALTSCEALCRSHDEDQRAHALLEAAIVRRDAEIERLRLIEDASAGVMVNLELARAEVEQLKGVDMLVAEIKRLRLIEDASDLRMCREGFDDLAKGVEK